MVPGVNGVAITTVPINQPTIYDDLVRGSPYIICNSNLWVFQYKSLNSFFSKDC